MKQNYEIESGLRTNNYLEILKKRSAEIKNLFHDDFLLLLNQRQSVFIVMCFSLTGNL